MNRRSVIKAAAFIPFLNISTLKWKNLIEVLPGQFFDVGDWEVEYKKPTTYHGGSGNEYEVFEEHGSWCHVAREFPDLKSFEKYFNKCSEFSKEILKSPYAEPGTIYIDSRPNKYNIGIRCAQPEFEFVKFGNRRLDLPVGCYTQHVISHNNLAYCKYVNTDILMTKMSYEDVKLGISMLGDFNTDADRYSIRYVYVDQNRNMRLVKYYFNEIGGPVTKATSIDGSRV